MPEFPHYPAESMTATVSWSLERLHDMGTTVLLADDSRAVRERVRAFLERQGFDVLGEAADGDEAVRLTRALDPDVAVLDLAMPRCSGLDAARDIRQACPRTQVILLTNYTDEYLIDTALRSGIRGYVAKHAVSEDLVTAITEIRRGGTFLSPSVAAPEA
jgi:DNA-binding NarL/FixJ family response regulator